AVEELPGLDLLPRPQSFLDRRNPPDRLVDPDDVVRAKPLHRDDRGHDLRRRGDPEPLVRVLRPEDGPVDGVDQDRPLRGHLDPVARQGSALVEERLALPGRGGHEGEADDQREEGESAHRPRVTPNPAAYTCDRMQLRDLPSVDELARASDDPLAVEA